MGNFLKRKITPKLIVLAVLFFLPQASFAIFYVGAALCFLVFFITSQIVRIDKISVIIAFLLFSYFLVSILRYSEVKNLYDFKELAKPLLFLLIYSFLPRIDIKQLTIVFSAYVVFDAYITFSQFFLQNNVFLDYITNLYSTKNHIETSLNLASPRSLGLSPGPAQHGVIMLCLFNFFVIQLIYEKTSAFYVIMCFLIAACVFMAQSKTMLLVFSLESLFMSYLFFRRKTGRERLIFTFGLLLLLAGIIFWIDTILATFHSLNRLIESGASTTSLWARVELWTGFLNVVGSSDFLYIMLGVGRGYLAYNGLHHSSFDNDYIYFLVVYGGVGLFVFLAVGVLIFLSFLREEGGQGGVISKIIWYSFIFGGVAACVVGFYIDLKVIVFFSLLMSALTSAERKVLAKEV